MKTICWSTFLFSITAVSAFSVGRTPVSTTALSAKKKAAPDDGSVDPAKRAALDGVLNQIERSYGRGSIVKLGDADNMIVDSISSGALTLDAALGGGFPKGRVIEIYGPESSGKTTLALHAIAECQREGGTAAFIDAEHALDPAYGMYSQANGGRRTPVGSSKSNIFDYSCQQLDAWVSKWMSYLSVNLIVGRWLWTLSINLYAVLRLISLWWTR